MPAAPWDPACTQTGAQQQRRGASSAGACVNEGPPHGRQLLVHDVGPCLGLTHGCGCWLRRHNSNWAGPAALRPRRRCRPPCTAAAAAAAAAVATTSPPSPARAQTCLHCQALPLQSDCDALGDGHWLYANAGLLGLHVYRAGPGEGCLHRVWLPDCCANLCSCCPGASAGVASVRQCRLCLNTPGCAT
jgi:hypothetical protein